jgi:hypothetical protein
VDSVHKPAAKVVAHNNDRSNLSVAADNKPVADNMADRNDVVDSVHKVVI